MFHGMPVKLYFIKCSERKVSHRIFAFKNFAKSTEKHLCRSLFINKVAGWKLEIVRNSHWGCSVKKDVRKNFPKFHRKKPVLESLFNKVPYTVSEFQFRSANYTVFAKIRINFEQNKPFW